MYWRAIASPVDPDQATAARAPARPKVFTRPDRRRIRAVEVSTPSRNCVQAGQSRLRGQSGRTTNVARTLLIEMR